jgi:hypothetical protein
MNRITALAQGFTIDDGQRLIAYKGARFNPSSWKTVPTEEEERLDAMVAELETQLAEREKQVVMLREALIESSPLMVLGNSWKTVGIKVREALAATQDLKDCIICYAKPIGYEIETMDNKKMLMREACHLVGHRSEPLYEARKP